MRRVRFLSLGLPFLLAGALFADYPEDVTLTIWQDCYPPEEWVWFTIANNGDSLIGNPGFPPRDVYSLQTGLRVWPPEALAEPWELPAETSRDYFWEQYGMGGDPYVEEGFYEVVLSYRTTLEGPWYTARDTVEISSGCSPTAIDQRSWGSLKGLFR